jgi:hypothetical protein
MASICSDGKPDWLKNAVREVVAALKDGASPLGMSAQHEDDLVAQFEDSFCTNLRSKEDWASHQRRVLEVARIHGGYAAAFTIMAEIANTGKMPTELNPTMTGLAGVLVQGVHCPSPAKVLGRPCNNVAFLSNPQREHLRAKYEALLRAIDEAN